MERHRLRRLLITLLLALAGTLTACGSSESSEGGGSADQAAAKAMIGPYLKTPSRFPVSTPLKTSPVGKKVAFLDVGTPTSALIYQLMTPAAEALGMDLVRIDSGQAADTVATAFDTVLSGGYDGVVVTSLSPALWERELEKLREADVAVVTSGVTGLTAEQVPVRLSNEVTSKHWGELLAAYVVAEHGAGVDAVFYQTPEVEPSRLMAEGFEEKFAELCSGCHVRLSDIPAATLGSTAPTLVTNDLQANPETDIAVFALGEQANGLNRALKVAGLEPEVVAAHPTPETLQQVQDGVITAVLASDTASMAWTAADSIARLMTGQDPDPGAVADEVPIQFLTRDQIPEDVSGGWVAYPDYADRFKGLWQRALS